MLQFLGRFEILAGIGLAFVCAAIILSIRRRSKPKQVKPKQSVKQRQEVDEMIQFFPSAKVENRPRTVKENEPEDELEEASPSSTPKPRNIIGSSHAWQSVEFYEPSFQTTPRIPEKVKVTFKSRKKPWKYKSVFIVWLDSTSLESWIHLEEAQELSPSKVVSMGWIIHESDEYLVLASSIGEDDVCLSPTIILKAAILHMEETPLGYTPSSS